MRARERGGFGWKRWSKEWLYGKLGLYHDYRLRRPWSLPKAQPAVPDSQTLMRSQQVSPLPEIGTMGLRWRRLETVLRFGY